MIALAEAPASSLNGQLAVRELEEKIVSVHNSVICSLNQLLDLKDLGTGFHSTRLAEWALRVAQQLGLPESRFRDLEVAALLHDIGKVGIPDSILKKPGALTDDEYNLMKKHPEYGWAVIRMFDDLKESSRYILHHHEAFNGRGYPAGLRETEIPIGARIVSVIDAFDAMISWRPYRKGLPLDEVLRRLILGSGTQFDPNGGSVLCSHGSLGTEPRLRGDRNGPDGRRLGRGEYRHRRASAGTRRINWRSPCGGCRGPNEPAM